MKFWQYTSKLLRFGKIERIGNPFKTIQLIHSRQYKNISFESFPKSETI